jgi:hypothetical protein
MTYTDAGISSLTRDEPPISLNWVPCESTIPLGGLHRMNPLTNRTGAGPSTVRRERYSLKPDTAVSLQSGADVLATVVEIVHRLRSAGAFGIDYWSPSDETFLGSPSRCWHADVVEDVCGSLGRSLARLLSVDHALRVAVKDWHYDLLKLTLESGGSELTSSRSIMFKSAGTDLMSRSVRHLILLSAEHSRILE